MSVSAANTQPATGTARQPTRQPAGRWVQSEPVDSTKVIIDNLTTAVLLLGQRSGRAVVHQFPEPLVWEPGEGISTQVIGSNFGDDVTPFLHLALLGFITVS